MKLEHDYKIRVNPEQSKRIQEICFDMGIEWHKDLEYRGIVQRTKHPHLMIEEEYGIMSNPDNFGSDLSLTEISAEDFIAKYGKHSEAKTAEDWLKEIKCPEIRRRALYDYKVNRGEPVFGDDRLKEAISFISWADDLPNSCYWQAIYDDAPNIKTHDDYKHLIEGEDAPMFSTEELIEMCSNPEKEEKPLAIPFKKCYTKITQHNFLIQ